ncbi:hypothetical protein L9F63_022723, partial [Diploptera punctata]
MILHHNSFWAFKGHDECSSRNDINTPREREYADYQTIQQRPGRLSITGYSIISSQVNSPFLEKPVLGRNATKGAQNQLHIFVCTCLGTISSVDVVAESTKPLHTSLGPVLYEEVHAVATNGSNRRIDIIAFRPITITGLMIGARE